MFIFLEISIVAKIIRLIFSIFSDWNKLSLSNLSFTNNTSVDTEEPLMRIACNMKSLKDMATMLCCVHEAIGLDELKVMSHSFKKDVKDACSYIKHSAHVSFFGYFHVLYYILPIILVTDVCGF